MNACFTDTDFFPDFRVDKHILKLEKFMVHVT